ncbi:hypothetical protein [Methylobacterium sp. A54F]
MVAKQAELEARIIALEYALEVLVNCLTDARAIRPTKIANLLTAAAPEAQSACGSPEVAAALKQLALKLG